MSTATLEPTTITAAPAPGTTAGPSHIAGLRCRACGRPEEIGPNFVCTACFGPLEVVYDYDVARERLTREAIAARPATIWRYLELLPVDAAPGGAVMPPDVGTVVGSRVAVVIDGPPRGGTRPPKTKRPFLGGRV